ncbi:hypothetical protein [Nonomuraea sp. LPB2021202275-12-8]|uniref:hypothetical protein n=1 Tax=Nonomuraea sp. LPB2021202275-12-8 TaxID=3120159 RepID=UPI00300BFEED
MAVMTRSARRTVSWQVLLAIMVEVFLIVPVGVFYGLLAAGAGQWVALLAGGAVPMAVLVHKVVSGGRIDGLDWFAIGTSGRACGRSPPCGAARVALDYH